MCNKNEKPITPNINFLTLTNMTLNFAFGILIIQNSILICCHGIKTCKVEPDDISNSYLKDGSEMSKKTNFQSYSNEIQFKMPKGSEYSIGNNSFKWEREKVYSGNGKVKGKGKEKMSDTTSEYKKQTENLREISNYQTRCVKCDISFRYDKTFVEHCKRKHGNEKPFDCPKCFKKYAYKNALRAHFKLKHGECDLKLRCKNRLETVLCETCDVTFEGWTLYEIHVLAKHEGVKMMPCSRCPKKFFRRTSVLKHEQVKHSAEFKCAHCGNIFDRTDELKEHEGLCVERQLKKRTGDKAPDTKSVNFEHIRIRCDECGGEFESFNALKNHYKSGHPEIKLFPCDYCSRAFRQKSTLERHVDMRHPDKHFDLKLTEKYRRGKRYACGYCDNEMVGITEYEKHGSREHAGLPLFSCRDCGEGFPRINSLKTHANEVHSQFKKGCSYCTKYYYRANRLLEHEVACKRSKEKRELLEKEGASRYHCDVCGKDVFVINAKSVNHHVRWHRNFDVCDICKSGFNRVRNPSGLAKHMQARHPRSVVEKTPLNKNSLENGDIVVKDEECLSKEDEFLTEEESDDIDSFVE